LTSAGPHCTSFFFVAVAIVFSPYAVTVQQHRICFVIGLLVCNSTLRRPLPRICGTAEQFPARYSF
jgi:hypothetical protein